MNLAIRDMRHDNNMLKYLIGPPPIGIIPWLYIDQWGVIHGPIYQPNMMIQNHSIHYYYMDQKKKRVFSSIFELLHCLMF
jgi:hypothetical protein